MPGRSGARRVRRAREFSEAHRGDLDVRTLRRVLDIARAGYAAWLRDPRANRTKEDKRMPGLSRASYQASQGVDGARRVFLDLREAGEECGLHRVERLMRENGIRAPKATERRIGSPQGRRPCSLIW